jgi:transcription elongation GreA/GreB family factor
MNKQIIRRLILEQLDREWRTQNSAADLARDEATHEETRAESKYDTHSQEAAYLAEGQARQAAAIADARAVYQAMSFPEFGNLSPVALGALVHLETAGSTAWYFMGPLRGGMQLHLNDADIMVITPQSPLGLKLMGAKAGDALHFPHRTGRILCVQ